jgi:signal transduction histidine kinase
MLIALFTFFYWYGGEEQKQLASILYAGMFCLLVLQAAYTAHARKRNIPEERDFLSACAHQIRTPLTAARWGVGEMGRSTASEQEQADLRKTCAAALQKMDALLGTLEQLTYSRNGRLQKNPAHVDICEEIEQAVLESAPLGKQYGVSIAAEGPCEELWVNVDPMQINFVLSNLIANGSKYNRRGGVVTVSARRLHSGKEIEVQVRDSGIGIPAGEQKKIFTRFFRGEQAVRMNREGTGLGLFVAKTIIEENGGRIWVESVPGKGATFCFVLPAKQ